MLVRTAVLAALASVPAMPLAAQGFSIQDVPSATMVAPADLKPKTIAYSDHRDDPIAARDTGLMRFDDWARERAFQKQQLSPYPGYGPPAEPASGSPTAVRAGGPSGAARAVRDNPYMYLVEARFVLPKPASSIDLARLAALPFLERVDPAIKHRLIAASDIAAGDRNPERSWCEGGLSTICIQSRYEFEGQLPAGIRLANKITEASKKIPDFIEFQSELRLLSGDEIARREIAKLTGIEAPVAGAVEQTIFHVNQVLQFGKFLAVLQAHPADPQKTVATAFVALAIKASVLERQREYQKMPILRNLVPAQVLMGKSSFNSGTSISAGLPAYARNRIVAVAGMLEQQ